jgi:hypothetical protein
VQTKLTYLRLGGWAPARKNNLLLALQVFFVVQSASRGMDYVQPRPSGPPAPSLTSIEAALPLPVWGTACLLAAAAIVCGLFGGWAGPIIAGHAALAGLYAAFSYGLLDQAPLRSPMLSLLGAVPLIVGFLLGLSRWRTRQVLRFWLSLLAVLGGGWLCAYGLGYDFRTGTGLLGAALSHTVLSVGIAYLAFRDPQTPIETGAR